MISGIITAILIIAFLGIVWWAYTPAHKQRFAEDANLVFADEMRAPDSSANKETSP